ncbi:hypothetical protein [Legionella spiritensis]|uniref:Uncharacterized protein n=1 Tax=Legionella spiritensis TaxID=452 RepID=A0A0W0ZBE5_LEGSP|nr:hypothetical protein [Legionella spiritensis]KTD66243.1 hypothetical protein Lspi_0006 [Legionella spiritensis]SNV48299.1 Uncharacterised protein [Legionella spiritensis]
MTAEFEQLKQWITRMALLIDESTDPVPEYYTPFIHEPELALRLVDLIAELDEGALDDERPYYSACVFALDICVAQLQSAQENGNKMGGKTLRQLMSRMAETMLHSGHSLSFWLPVLNAFYEVHTELSPELKGAYLELAEREDDLTPEEESNHLNAIREMIEELSDLSVFDIAENFFAQSYAMPEDFFADLMIDLYSIDTGQDIALLLLLHPKSEVRAIVAATMEQLIDTIQFSSISLSRLQAIKNWYPPEYQEQFNRWIKIQRKKGVVFHHETTALPSFRLKASEVDGSGAQGIFIHVKQRRHNRLCGLLFKQDFGIKDAWMTPAIPAKDIAGYYDEAFDDTVTLRDVDTDYLLLLTNHFLALTLRQGAMPDLHLLEIQELLGLHFYPELMDIPAIMDRLSVQILPFTPEAMQASFKRSNRWTTGKKFTESWFIENAHIDKLVNRCSSFVEGVRVCDVETAMAHVFEQDMELHRDKWFFHFLWVTLWLKAKARKGEKMWWDSFFIAHAIAEETPLENIPVMRAICRQTVINSVETMNERRTHLNKE